MAKMLALLLATAPALAAASAVVVNEHPDDPVQAATELLQRILPGASGQFELELLPAQPDGVAAMQIGSKDGKVHLLGTGGVELASALNWYLNDYLNCTYDWNTYAEGQLPAAPDADDGAPPQPQLRNAPAADAALPLPLPERSAVRPRQVPYSYYMNVRPPHPTRQRLEHSPQCTSRAPPQVCTYGYSLAFVPWEYWVKHIDWMAMNGAPQLAESLPPGCVPNLWRKSAASASPTRGGRCGQASTCRWPSSGRSGYGRRSSRAMASAWRTSTTSTPARPSCRGSAWAT